jgi:hypothetical protein
MGASDDRGLVAPPGAIAFPPASGDWGTITHWMIVLPPAEPEPESVPKE